MGRDSLRGVARTCLLSFFFGIGIGAGTASGTKPRISSDVHDHGTIHFNGINRRKYEGMTAMGSLVRIASMTRSATSFELKVGTNLELTSSNIPVARMKYGHMSDV